MARTQQRKKEKREKKGRAQEDFKNVWLPVEMRRGQYRGTRMDQVGTQVSGMSHLDPCHHVLSAPHTGVLLPSDYITDVALALRVIKFLPWILHY